MSVVTPEQVDPDSDDRQAFDWNDDEGVIVFQGCERVACYANRHGDIVVRQQADWPEPDDSIVIIPRLYAERLAAAISEIASESSPPSEPRGENGARDG